MSFNTFIGIGLTLHVADTSAVAAIHRDLRGCCVRSQDPCYFVKGHNRPLFVNELMRKRILSRSQIFELARENRQETKTLSQWGPSSRTKGPPPSTRAV